jgi:hypothetical protein
MSHIRVLICRLHDPTSETMTELAAFDLPQADVTTLQPQTALDDLEITAHIAGTAMVRHLFQAQWRIAVQPEEVAWRESACPVGLGRRN